MVNGASHVTFPGAKCLGPLWHTVLVRGEGEGKIGLLLLWCVLGCVLLSGEGLCDLLALQVCVCLTFLPNKCLRIIFQNGSLE